MKHFYLFLKNLLIHDGMPGCNEYVTIRKYHSCWPCFFTLLLACLALFAGTATILATFTAAGIIITVAGSKQYCAD